MIIEQFLHWHLLYSKQIKEFFATNDVANRNMEGKFVLQRIWHCVFYFAILHPLTQVTLLVTPNSTMSVPTCP